MTHTNADHRRTAIVEAAALLFEKRGYHDTGMDDIAEAVGLRKPTLYYYVRSKAEILVMIHNSVMDSVLNELEKNAAESIEPREGLRRVVTSIIEIMDTKPGYLRVFFEHHREVPEPLRTDAIRKRDRYQYLVESMIQRGIQQGTFRNVRARAATLALFGITNWSYQWYRPDGTLSYREVADELLDIYLQGIQVHDAPTS